MSAPAPDESDWLRGLPATVAGLLRRWDLTADGAPMAGRCARVFPVRRGAERLMLKVSRPDPESATEHLALRHWDGRGAVRLVAAWPGEQALLLEALDPGTNLRDLYIDDAGKIIGGLLARLHVPAPPTVAPLREVVGAWLEPLRAHPPSLPRRAVDRALEIFDDRPGGDRLLHTDLHYDNVLAAEREPWLAIDPKPLAGPAGFEIYPALRNRTDEYGTGAELRWAVRHRVEVISEAAGIDWDDAREWSIVRAVLDAHWAAAEGDREHTTLALAVAQALDVR